MKNLNTAISAVLFGVASPADVPFDQLQSNIFSSLESLRLNQEAQFRRLQQLALDDISKVLSQSGNSDALSLVGSLVSPLTTGIDTIAKDSYLKDFASNIGPTARSSNAGLNLLQYLLTAPSADSPSFLGQTASLPALPNGGAGLILPASNAQVALASPSMIPSLASPLGSLSPPTSASLSAPSLPILAIPTLPPLQALEQLEATLRDIVNKFPTLPPSVISPAGIITNTPAPPPGTGQAEDYVQSPVSTSTQASPTPVLAARDPSANSNPIFLALANSYITDYKLNDAGQQAIAASGMSRLAAGSSVLENALSGNSVCVDSSSGKLTDDVSEALGQVGIQASTPAELCSAALTLVTSMGPSLGNNVIRRVLSPSVWHDFTSGMGGFADSVNETRNSAAGVAVREDVNQAKQVLSGSLTEVWNRIQKGDTHAPKFNSLVEKVKRLRNRSSGRLLQSNETGQQRRLGISSQADISQIIAAQSKGNRAAAQSNGVEAMFSAIQQQQQQQGASLGSASPQDPANQILPPSASQVSVTSAPIAANIATDLPTSLPTAAAPSARNSSVVASLLEAFKQSGLDEKALEAMVNLEDRTVQAIRTENMQPQGSASGGLMSGLANQGTGLESAAAAAAAQLQALFGNAPAFASLFRGGAASGRLLQEKKDVLRNGVSRRFEKVRSSLLGGDGRVLAEEVDEVVPGRAPDVELTFDKIVPFTETASGANSSSVWKTEIIEIPELVYNSVESPLVPPMLVCWALTNPLNLASTVQHSGVSSWPSFVIESAKLELVPIASNSTRVGEGSILAPVLATDADDMSTNLLAPDMDNPFLLFSSGWNSSQIRSLKSNEGCIWVPTCRLAEVVFTSGSSAPLSPRLSFEGLQFPTAGDTKETPKIRVVVRAFASQGMWTAEKDGDKTGSISTATESLDASPFFLFEMPMEMTDGDETDGEGAAARSAGSVTISGYSVEVTAKATDFKKKDVTQTVTEEDYAKIPTQLRSIYKQLYRKLAHLSGDASVFAANASMGAQPSFPITTPEFTFLPRVLVESLSRFNSTADGGSGSGRSFLQRCLPTSSDGSSPRSPLTSTFLEMMFQSRNAVETVVRIKSSLESVPVSAMFTDSEGFGTFDLRPSLIEDYKNINWDIHAELSRIKNPLLDASLFGF